MKCIQDCQTFLWRGAGIPMIDDDGNCYCACGAKWSAYNILGVPSCVPPKAHFIFGVVGLLTTIISLYHSAHQLNRQVKYHARYLAASTSPVEQCRWQLHVVVIIHAVLSLCYFSMVLALEDHQLWGAVILMSGLTQFTTNIGGMLTLRMWIYTNDSRLVQDTPEIMAVSNALERPVGQHATRCVVCIGAFVGTILSAARHSQTATEVACVAFVCMCVIVLLAVFKCGLSLLRTIERSMLRKSSSATNTRNMTAAGKEIQERGGRLDDLLAARKKIVIATSVCLVLGAGTVVILLFSVSSPFGMFAPLLFFATPMIFGPLIWFGLNIQLHAGRSKRRASQGIISGATSKPKKKFGWNERTRAGCTSVFARGQLIAPTEAPASP